MSLPRFQDWMPKSEQGRICCNEESLLVIKCAHEMQEVRVMNRIASFTFEDDGGKHKELWLAELDISPMECTALFKFLGYIRNLNKLVITRCRTKHFAFRELANFLCKDNDITALVMHYLGMTDQDAKHIIDALGNKKCKVTKLNIDTNILTDESVEYLSGVLKSGNCKLTELHIGLNELTDESAKYLSDALKSNKCKLTELDMSRNNVTDQGAKYLSDALKSDKCKLTKLNIRNNKLTHKGDKYLRDVKNDNGEHTELNIISSWNTLTAHATYLSDDLDSPHYQSTSC
jgi:Ran GTPase-activating protein (RanGAP) involved in mRNA processing and transport